MSDIEAKQREEVEAAKNRAANIHSLSDCHNYVTGLMEGMQSGKFQPHVVVQMALDVLLVVPPEKEYWVKISSLFAVCGAEHWIGPLFTRLKQQPESYAKFSEYYVCDPYSGPSYFVLGLQKKGLEDSKGSAIPTAMRGRLEAILACAEDPRPEVHRVGSAALRIIARELMWPRFRDNVEDLVAWRGWMRENS